MKIFNAKILDPVCGMKVDPKIALCSERDGKQFYFCSQYCRNAFLTAPAGTQPNAIAASTMG
jgi:P-type Cu+ transporter